MFTRQGRFLQRGHSVEPLRDPKRFIIRLYLPQALSLLNCFAYMISKSQSNLDFLELPDNSNQESFPLPQ